MQLQRRRPKERGDCVVHKPVPSAEGIVLIEATPEELELMYVKLADSIPAWGGLLIAERVSPECAARLAEGAEVESAVQAPEVAQFFSRLLGVEAEVQGGKPERYDVLLVALAREAGIDCCWLAWLL